MTTVLDLTNAVESARLSSLPNYLGDSHKANKSDARKAIRGAYISGTISKPLLLSLAKYINKI